MNKILRMLAYGYQVTVFVRSVTYAIMCFVQNRAYPFKAIKMKGLSCEINKLKDNGHLDLTDNVVDNKKLDILLNELDCMNAKEVFNNKKILQKKVYKSSDLSSSRAFLELALNPKVLYMVKEYLGVWPRIAYLAVWKVEPNAEDLGEMNFHMDHHGFKYIKAFYYLSSIEDGGGQHEYIEGSHNENRFDKKLNRIDKNKSEIWPEIKLKRQKKGKFKLNTQLLQKYLKDDIVKKIGKSGTSFLEDTNGLHRGTKIKNGKERILFQVLYTPFVMSKDIQQKSNLRSALNCIVKENVDYEELFPYVAKYIVSK